MTRDYYQVLGVKVGASEAEIRNAYKRLAKKHHPDANAGSKTAEESFKGISEAYQVLSDPQKRRRYDALRAEDATGGSYRQAPRGFGGVEYQDVDFGSGDLGGIFADLFGRGAQGAQGPRRGEDLEYEASIDFDEAIHGTRITVPLARNVTCQTCGGSGRSVASGRDRATPCRKCGGEGSVRSSESITVGVPAGADEGTRVRVAGSGEGGRRGGPAGDLYIILRVRPHKYFRREGDDVVLEVPLSFSEAALGAKVEVPTLEGRASVTIPAGTRSGQRFRLRGKGAPLRDGHGRGDLIAITAIVPPKIDAQAKRLLQELASLDVESPRESLDW